MEVLGGGAVSYERGTLVAGAGRCASCVPSVTEILRGWLCGAVDTLKLFGEHSLSKKGDGQGRVEGVGPPPMTERSHRAIAVIVGRVST